MPNAFPVPVATMRILSATLCSAASLLLWASIAAAASESPSGVISCSVASPYGGDAQIKDAFAFLPYLSAEPRTARARATNVTSTCDNSGVTGGKTLIRGVLFKLLGKLPDATCSSFLSGASVLTNGRLSVRWRGINREGKPMTVSSSKATIASVSFDEDARVLTLVTDPVAAGAFLGETITLRLGFDGDDAFFASPCPTEHVRMSRLPFGNGNPSSIDVQ